MRRLRGEKSYSKMKLIMFTSISLVLLALINETNYADKNVFKFKTRNYIIFQLAYFPIALEQYEMKEFGLFTNILFVNKFNLTEDRNYTINMTSALLLEEYMESLYNVKKNVCLIK